MKPKTMILMVVAVTCGLGASYMTSRLLAERSSAGDDTEKISILVAKRNLETGATIKNPQDMFVFKQVAKDDEPKNALMKFEDLKSRVLKHALREGDFVSASDIVSDKDQLMAYLLPKGFRAFGIRVNIESIAGGFASLPLSRVDLISTVRRGDDKSSYSQVLLQNVLVLAADQQILRSEDKGAMPATVVTVALPPEDITRVALAQQFGSMSLVLRKFNDNAEVDPSKSKVTFDEILNNKRNEPVTETAEQAPAVVKAPPPEPKVPEAPKTRTHMVLVVNGERQEQTEFTLDENGDVISSRVVAREGGRLENPPAPVAPPPPPVQPNQGPNS